VSSRFAWLDFDIENRPLSYLFQDFTTADITAIACSWYGQSEVFCWVQTKDRRSQRKMLRAFREMYEQADGVTGHYIRKHDLPIVNGALMELGLPPLGPKLTCDTKLDLKKRAGISGSQENLAAMLEVPKPKVKMNTATWREANRLTPEGIEATKARVIGDVVQHKALRRRLIELDLLGPPRMWRP
jgi:hypothetical protein